jgi:hypothetical protein
MFIEHSEHTGASRSSVKPPINGVVIRIFLGLEEDVMVSTSIKFKVS